MNAPASVIRVPGLSTMLPFSHAVRAGPFLYLSGQASVNHAGAIVVDTFRGEMERTIANIRAVLAAAGLGLDAIVQARGYLRDEKDFKEYNTIYREHFRDPYPARTTIVRCLSAVQVELEVIAYQCDAPAGAKPR